MKIFTLILCLKVFVEETCSDEDEACMDYESEFEDMVENSSADFQTYSCAQNVSERLQTNSEKNNDVNPLQGMSKSVHSREF